MLIQHMTISCPSPSWAGFVQVRQSENRDWTTTEKICPQDVTRLSRVISTCKDYPISQIKSTQRKERIINKKISTISNDLIIVTSSLTKDMTGTEDSHQATAIPTLFKTTDVLI